MKLRKITPWLSFDEQAEQAARFYAGIFRERLSQGGDSKAQPGLLPERLSDAPSRKSEKAAAQGAG